MLVIDSAMDLRTWNHLVTTVVAGTRPDAENPAPNAMNARYTAQSCSTRPSITSAPPATRAPMHMMPRTSRRLMTRATPRPTTPPAKNCSATPRETLDSENPWASRSASL